MLDAPNIKGNGLSADTLFKPKPQESWLTKAGNFAGAGLDAANKVLGVPGEILAASPAGQAVSNAVGVAGKVIGGAVGGIGETGIQAVNAAQGKGFDVNKIGQSAMDTANATGDFGKQIGTEGVKQLPAAIALDPETMLNSATKVGKQAIDATTETGGKILDATRDAATPINENVKAVLTDPTRGEHVAEKLKQYFTEAEAAQKGQGALPTTQLTGKRATDEAFTVLKAHLAEAGKAKEAALAAVGEKTVPMDSTNTLFSDLLEKRLGTQVDAEGKFMSVGGRLSTVAARPAETAALKDISSTLETLGQNPSVQELDDAISNLGSEVDKMKTVGAVQINSKTQSVLKEVIQHMKDQRDASAGPELAQANANYSKFKQLQEDASKAIGKGSKKAGDFMSSVADVTNKGSTATAAKTLAQRLQEATGVPFFEDATLAKYAQDAVGNPNARSIVEILSDVKDKGLIKPLLAHLIDKLGDAKGAATRLEKSAPKATLLKANDLNKSQKGLTQVAPLLMGGLTSAGILSEIQNVKRGKVATTNETKPKIGVVNPYVAKDVNTNKVLSVIRHQESRGEKQPYSFSQSSGKKTQGKALGAYQVTEGELKTYAKKYLGRDVTPKEFLESPKLQDTYMTNKIQRFQNEFGMNLNEIFGAHRGGINGRNDKEYSKYVDEALALYNKK